MAIRIVAEIDEDINGVNVPFDMSPYVTGDIFVNFPHQNGEFVQPYASILGGSTGPGAMVYYSTTSELDFTGEFTIHGYVLRGVTSTWYSGVYYTDNTFPEADLSAINFNVTDSLEISIPYWIHDHKEYVLSEDPPGYYPYDQGSLVANNGLVERYVTDVGLGVSSFLDGVEGMLTKRWGAAGNGPIFPATSYTEDPPGYASSFNNRRYIFLESGGRLHQPFSLVTP